jgi:hypothetical protein
MGMSCYRKGLVPDLVVHNGANPHRLVHWYEYFDTAGGRRVTAFTMSARAPGQSLG